MQKFMNKAAALALFSLACMSTIVAQSPEGSSSPWPPAGNYGQQISPAPSTSTEVIASTEMHAILETPLSTRTAKPGDRFVVMITDPVRGANGLVAIPAASRVEGEVSEAVQGNGQPALAGKGKLSLVFRDVLLSTGQTLPITAALVSVNTTSGTGTRSVGEPGGPAFGPPLKGLAIGQLLGGGSVIATKSKEIILPARTGVVIRLDQPLTATTSQHQPMP